MNAETLDLIAAMTVVALAVWGLARTLRAPAGCASCPTAPPPAATRGTHIALQSTSLGRRRRT